MNSDPALSIYSPSMRVFDNQDNLNVRRQSTGYIKSKLFFKKFISKLYNGFSSGSTNLKSYINLSKPLKKKEESISQVMKSEFLYDKEQISKFGKLTKNSYFVKLYKKLENDSEYRPSELNLTQMKDSITRRKAIMMLNKYKSENKLKLPKTTANFNFKRGSVRAPIKNEKRPIDIASPAKRRQSKQLKLICIKKKTAENMKNSTTEPKSSEVPSKIPSFKQSSVSIATRRNKELTINEFNKATTTVSNNDKKRFTMFATEYGLAPILNDSAEETPSKSGKESKTSKPLPKIANNSNLSFKSQFATNIQLAQHLNAVYSDEKAKINTTLNSTSTLLNVRDGLENSKLNAYLTKIAKFTSAKIRNLDSIISNGSKTNNEIQESANRTLTEQESLKESSRIIKKLSNKNLIGKKAGDSNTTVNKSYIRKFSTKNINDTLVFGDKLLESQNKSIKTQTKMNDLLFRSFYMTNDTSNRKNSTHVSNLNEERFNNYKNKAFSLLNQVDEYKQEGQNRPNMEAELMKNLSTDRISTLIRNLNSIGFEYDFAKYSTECPNQVLNSQNQHFSYNNLHRILQYNKLVKCKSNSVMSSNPSDYIKMKKSRRIENQIQEFKIKQQSLELPSNIKTKFKSNTNRKYNEFSGCYIGKR